MRETRMLAGILHAFIVLVAARRCPVDYTLYRNGDCIRILGLNKEGRVDLMTEFALDECGKDGAYPPIIHDQKSQDRLLDLYRSGAGSWITILGLVCDTQTNRFRWADGSLLDYVSNIKSDVACAGSWVYSNRKGWNMLKPPGTEGYSWSIQCIKSFHSHMDAICYDFERSISADGKTNTCYQVSDHTTNWPSAQKSCQANFASLASIHDSKENDFVRNMSLSKGYRTGVHIGASLSGKDSEFGWIDGSDMDFDNFYGGFPMDGLGGCSAMDISSGKWMNDDCSTELPFVCKRDPEAVTPACSSRVYAPGEIITPPGYPLSASEPCDYFLKADTGKIVELEILLLEANACCDHLLIYNGQFESEPFADLTGADREGEIFRTTSTVNIMRVSWQPKGAVNVRGFVMTFRAV